MIKFRPLDYNRPRWLSWRRKTGDSRGQYNWSQNYSDRLWRKIKWPRYYKIGQHLQYLALHAPPSVRSKWRLNWRRFSNKYRKF
jgi:hypothetical protein